MTFARRGCVLVVLILAGAVAGGAEDSVGQPVLWLALERGRVQFENRQFGEALRTLLAARQMGGVHAETELALARSWVYEGELDLAVDAYRRAYELRDSLYTPEQQYVILEELAELARLRRDYTTMEESYETIVADDTLFAGTDSRLTDRILDNYRSAGIGKVLELYRLRESFAVNAHRELAWFLYRNGRYTGSLRHGLHAAVVVLTIALEELREADPEHRFIDLRRTLEQGQARASVAELFEVTNIGRILYYLAGASYAAGSTGRATEIWTVLADFEGAGRYRELSRLQLVEPWVEKPDEPFRGAQ